MRTLDRLSLLLGLTLTALLPVTSVGCGAEETLESDGLDAAPVDEGDGDADEKEAPEVPEFPVNSGQAAQPQLAYPAGPYGTSKGSILPNFKFVGFANSMLDRSYLQLLQVAEFYNPTGDEVFPEGGQYTGPKPKALVVIVSSVWCGPCNYEAKSILPGEYAKFRPMGGEFLLALADGKTQGVAAKTKALVDWTAKYKVDYPSVIDPSYKLDQLFVSPSYPSNFIIDTRTMKIVHAIAGAPDDSFWNKFEQILTGG